MEQQENPNQQSDDQQHQTGQIPPKSAKKGSKKPLIVLLVLVLIAIVVAVGWWFAHRNLEDTDDAFIDGNVVAIAPKVSGHVIELAVKDNAWVHKGDLLLKIDPRDYVVQKEQAEADLGLAQSQLEQARAQLEVAQTQYPSQYSQADAQLAAAQASLANAKTQYQRQRAVDPRATSQANVDNANAQLRSAQANVDSAAAQVKVARQVPVQIKVVRSTVMQREQQVKAAQAKLDQADLSLSYTEIRAVSDGWVTRRTVQLGTLAQAGQPLFMMVSPDIWVTANFKESQLERMAPGSRVSIRVDAYPNLRLEGHIDSMQLGTGSRFSAFPAENATGNFVKIVQRVPVKIVIDRGLDPARPLPLGLSVVPEVELK